jgi:DNA polymerase-3 subunit epsilon
MRDAFDVCGCFPTGRHYPGVAEQLAKIVTRVPGLCGDFDVAAAWRDLPLVALDFETTGLSPESDRIIEIGAVCFDGGQRGARMNRLVNPGIPVPEEARSVHRISDEELESAPAFADVFGEFRDLLGGRLPIAYNSDFDRDFLHAEFNRLDTAESADAGLPPALQPNVAWIDPLVWIRELQRDEKSKKLTDVCARLGIELEQAHRAASDAEAAARVLFEVAPRLPTPYGELIRIQRQYAARQQIGSSAWRGRKS